MDKEIIIKPNFIFKDYLRVNYYLLINSRYGLIMSIIIFLVLGYYCFGVINGTISVFDIIFFLIIILFLIPTLMYIKTKRALSDPRLKENIQFKINKSNFSDIGQSYHINYKLCDLIKLKETKNFFLFFITNHMVKVIRKADLKDNQYNELKELFSSLNIKKSLK